MGPSATFMQATENSSATPTEPGTEPAAPPPNQRTLARNTLYLTLGNAATIPVAVATNALTGRYLGPTEFGYGYLATTLCTFAVLALEWGQQGALPALVARDRTHAGTYLGTCLVWRALMSALISGVLALICQLLGYDSGQRWAVALAFPVAALLSCGGAFKDTIRGFERTDIPALAHVAQQVLVLLAVVPVLLLGGHLRAVLLSNMAVAASILLVLRRVLRPLGIGELQFRRGSLQALFGLGTPFVLFELAMVLLPIINATFLSKLVPAPVIGWYGVSQRLVGLLIFPASALISALYPTLCRLHVEDQTEFGRVTRNALYGVALLAAPAAVGCGMFPELGVAIFGTRKFAGATAHLRVMSAFVFLVYFSMPLGSCILASNRQRAWALVQCVCIIVSVCLNPFVIPYFQAHTGNGALGTCVTLVISEAVVVTCGIAMAPRGVFNWELGKSLLLASVSGAVMALVAWLIKPFSLFLAVPAAVSTYAVAVWLTGAVQPSTIAMVKSFVARKLSRAS